ncbi:MAG TPA: RNA-binding domain-containing protein [Ignavibacteriales bacterium]|nr:RNA-binding domain-containing protein [Ignavibacteriales bacterium]
MTEAQLIQRLNELHSMPAETETVEFKEAKNGYDFNKIGKYFSALSNEANLKGNDEAWLIFGVEDRNKSIVGSNYRNTSRAHLDSLKGEVAGKTTNRITFIDIHELNLPEGRVVIFQIPAAPKGIPVAWEGHYYGREGEELSPLNLEEIERIRKQTAHVDWSAGICPEASIDDLEPKAIAKARENFKIKNPRLTDEVETWDDATFLNKAKITLNGKITRSAIILLGKPESEHHIQPGIAHITWILKDKANIEKDYEHFSCPFLLSVEGVLARIRNLKYRYLPEGTLFTQEIDQYDPFSIRESLNNCIAHQDYSLRGRINVVESEDSWLLFSNLGEFLPGSIENVIVSNQPSVYYRNEFLARAMVNLNMIDTIGSGIKRMFTVQSKRFFPMPDYDLTGGRVTARLTGKILDMDYVKILSRNPDLTLEEIILLDKVQKKKELSDEEVYLLKGKGLIEGRKPNFHFSLGIAEKTDQKAEYIKNKGFSDKYYKDLILEYLKKYKSAKRSDFEKLLLDKLSDVLDNRQKKDKVKNLLQSLKIEGKIYLTGRDWKIL